MCWFRQSGNVSLPAPTRLQNKTTNAKHAIGFCENVCQHLYGTGNSKQLTKGISKEDWIALHHFHPDIRPYICCHQKDTEGTQKWRVPLDVGKRCGLTDRDMCGTFYIAPTQRISQSHDEVNAIHQSKVRAAALNPTSTSVSVSKASRKSPAEKEY
jgi:hypothetical protein